uniref:Fibronectin type-III domain-containing protein n=1 Tax=Romanomermis culicivorax TaxID=13658 RepID=A0A915IN88_ROMCU
MGDIRRLMFLCLILFIVKNPMFGKNVENTSQTPPLEASIEKLEIGHDHLNVTWKPGKFDKSSKQPSGEKFYVKYRIQGEEEWMIMKNTTNATGFMISIYGLKPATTYEIVSVSDHVGLPVASKSLVFTTAGR